MIELKVGDTVEVRKSILSIGEGGRAYGIDRDGDNRLFVQPGMVGKITSLIPSHIPPNVVVQFPGRPKYGCNMDSQYLKLVHNSNKDTLDYRVAIQDRNAQAVLRTFMVDLSMRILDLDATDSILAYEIQKLMDSYESDMKGLARD